MSNTRRKHTKEFKAKVVLEALKERETLEYLAKKFELAPTQISLWKAEAISNFDLLFGVDKLNKYFVFYNTKRPHQSLKYETPIEVFRNVA